MIGVWDIELIRDWSAVCELGISDTKCVFSGNVSYEYDFRAWGGAVYFAVNGRTSLTVGQFAD